MKTIAIPKTPEYLSLKAYVLSSNFPWVYVETPFGPPTEEDKKLWNCFPYFSHSVLRSPGSGGDQNIFSLPNSEWAPLCNEVLKQINYENNLDINVVLRINFNLTLPSPNDRPDRKHVDHNFPHKNILVYLTECDGGETVVFGDTTEEYFPVEDTGIVFDGNQHYYFYPKYGRRVVMVVTYI